jgi:hypothetical protein
MEKQRGMAFGFRKTATAVKKTPDRYIEYQYFNNSSQGYAYLDWRVGLVLLCSARLPEGGTLVPKHVAD